MGIRGDAQARKEGLEQSPSASAGAGDRELVSELRRIIGWMDAVLAEVGDAIVVVDAEDDVMTIVYANDTFAAMLGRQRIFLHGASLKEHFPALRLAPTSSAKQTIESSILRADGSKLPLEIIARLWNASGRKYYTIVVNDLSARRASERRRAVRHAAFLSSSKDDDSTTIIRGVLQNIGEALNWKQAAYWVLNREADGLVCAGFWSQKTPGLREFEALSRRTVFKRGVGLPGRVWDAQSPAWIEDVTKDANFPRAPLARKEGLHGAFGFPVLLENEFHGVLEFFNDTIEKPDEELLQILQTSGEQLGLFIEHKRMEEEIRKSRLQQSEKMAAVGQLAAGVAHELNNPIAVILGFAQAARKRIDAASPISLPLASIEREAERCKNLVQGLLTFSRQNKGKMQEVDLDETVTSTLRIIEARARVKSVEVFTELGNPGPAFGDKNQLQQVIVNLCNNAIDAMPAGGKLTVRTKKNPGEIADRIALEIEDTGCGIPEEIRDKIFDPFFTTKEVGQGTGLGLSLAYEIIQKHKGSLELQSEVGRGTKFIILLPSIEA